MCVHMNLALSPEIAEERHLWGKEKAHAITKFCISLTSISLTFAIPFPCQTYPRDGLAEELGNAQIAAYKEGDFDAKEEDEDEDDE